MSKSHGDYLRIEHGTYSGPEVPLDEERHDDLRVLHGFVVDTLAHDDEPFSYEHACALARRAFELGRRSERALEINKLAPCYTKGPNPRHVSTREILDSWIDKPAFDKAFADAIVHGQGAVSGVDLGVEHLRHEEYKIHDALNKMGWCGDPEPSKMGWGWRGEPLPCGSAGPIEKNDIAESNTLAKDSQEKPTAEQLRLALRARIAAATKAASGA